MDDDQQFVKDLVDHVNDDFSVKEYDVKYSYEGRDAVIRVELVAGDIYHINVREQH